MGAPTWPPSPPRSARPSKTVARLLFHRGPDMAPKPPTFGPPRQSRGRASYFMGAPTWPPSPPRSARPGTAVARLLFALLDLRLDDGAPPAKEEILEAPEYQIESESQDADHRGPDEHPVDEEEVARLLDAIAEAAVGGDELRRNEHEESQREAQPQPDDDPGQR